MPSRNAVVVSLHDVSPLTWEACRRILAELARLNAAPASLLVIPDHHDRGDTRKHPAFCEWLKEQVALGHEAVLHGWQHLRPRPAREPFTQRWITQTYTADEGEFFDLPYDRARDLAQRGRDAFRQIGIEPSGFIAPAWLLGDEAERAIRDLGFSYTTRIGGVCDLQQQQVHPSQSLCWSVRAAWRRIASLAWNALLFRRLSGAPLMRIAVHPVDLEHSRVWAQILRLTSLAVEQRTPHTYESWLASWRTASPRDGGKSRPAAE
jgi:predicted deacetylase